MKILINLELGDNMDISTDVGRDEVDREVNLAELTLSVLGEDEVKDEFEAKDEVKDYDKDEVKDEVEA